MTIPWSWWENIDRWQILTWSIEELVLIPKNLLILGLVTSLTSPNVMRSRSYNPWCEWVKTVSSKLWSKTDPIIICFNQIDARICNVIQQSSSIDSYSFFVFSLAVPISNSKMMHLTWTSSPRSTNCSVSAAVSRPSYTIINVRSSCQAVFTLSNFFQKLKEVCVNLCNDIFKTYETNYRNGMVWYNRGQSSYLRRIYVWQVPQARTSSAFYGSLGLVLWSGLTLAMRSNGPHLKYRQITPPWREICRYRQVYTSMKEDRSISGLHLHEGRPVDIDRFTPPWRETRRYRQVYTSLKGDLSISGLRLHEGRPVDIDRFTPPWMETCRYRQVSTSMKGKLHRQIADTAHVPVKNKQKQTNDVLSVSHDSQTPRTWSLCFCKLYMYDED